MADLKPTIETEAKKSGSTTVEGNTTQRRSLDELRRADEYLQSDTVAAKKGRGIVLTKLKPPGAV